MAKFEKEDMKEQRNHVNREDGSKGVFYHDQASLVFRELCIIILTFCQGQGQYQNEGQEHHMMLGKPRA